MKVTVVGAGNMGLAITGYISLHSKANVTLFTTKSVSENGFIGVNDVENDTFNLTNNFSCTANPKIAFSNADVIFITYPAFLRRNFINMYSDFIKAGAFLGFVPGYGGAEYSCANLIDRGINIFGLQRVPYIARKNSIEGKTIVKILSRKRQLYTCSIPYSKTGEISEIIEKLLDIPVQPLKEYLSITLTPSNPLLHTTGLYNIFKNYAIGKQFDRPLKFYEEWNDEASKMLFRYDEELQNITKRLSPLNMEEVVPLPIYYESLTPTEMTQKLKSIESFKNVMAPLKNFQNGYNIDLSSRMFVEDFPFGVCIIKDFAIMTRVSVPTVDCLLDFYYRLSGHKYFKDDDSYTDEIQQTGVPGIHGLDNVNDIIKFYHR